MDIEKEIQKLLKKYPDPRKGAYGRAMFRYKKDEEHSFFKVGIVVDNRDPELLGRVRVEVMPYKFVTGWIPVAHTIVGDGWGSWCLPDIGVEVTLSLPFGCMEKAIVMGCIFTAKHRPPKHTTKNPADSIVFQTKAHRLEIIDEAGKEGIYLETAGGKIRITMNAEGIKIVNELGDVRVKAREATLKGKNINLSAKKEVTFESKGTMAIEGTKKVVLESEKEVTIQGSPIKIQGSRGVTSGGKQVAHGEDKVMGFDVHQMVVPSGSGTSVVPLPHPYIGKLKEKLSSDVKINGHNAATKGSVSKHDHPVHNQLPGTIKFNQNPTKEGEVTSGTAAKLKINGKEAAVVGSKVTTCNDNGAKDNSTILGSGTSMPMPVILNPKNAPEGDKEEKHPEFTQVKWSKTTVKEGEEIELTAVVKDIADGNSITFQIWKKGQDPDSNRASWAVRGELQGGSAVAKWVYELPAGEEVPEEDPEFFFTAHSAWCPYKKSGNLTVELLRPEITNCEWKDKDGKQIEEALIDDEVVISAEVKDIADGEQVRVEIWEHDDDNRHDFVLGFSGTVADGKLEIPWKVLYREDEDDSTSGKELAEKGYTLPEYHFVLQYKMIECAGPVLTVKDWAKLTLKDTTGTVLPNNKYVIYLHNGDRISGTSDENGDLEKISLPVGSIAIRIVKESENGD
jgi:uncharacterized Zn-binding protein involved in type VI secretion